MFFQIPTKIYSERDCVKKYAPEWTALGKKALIVTGRSSAVNGSLADVEEALRDNGVEYCVFDRTEANPSIEMVMKVRDYGVEESADFVIGVGGGSPMDAAKAIALMIANKDEGAELLYEKKKCGALPIVEVPTTCGTGSEVTPNAVLTIHAKRTKSSISHKMYPAYALADGKYLKDMNREVLVNTYVDALGHFLESYINSNATDFSRMLCEFGLKVWGDARKILSGAGVTAEEGDTLLFASTLAGMAIAHTGTAVPHGLSYYLTYEKGVPHGKAVGYFLPGYLAQADGAVQKKVLELIGFPDVQAFGEFITDALGPMEADEELMNRAVYGMLANEAKLKNVPYKVTEDVMWGICGGRQ